MMPDDLGCGPGTWSAESVFRRDAGVAPAIGEALWDRFRIGAVPEELVVIRRKRFTGHPGGLKRRFPLPVDADLKSKFSTYEISIADTVYEANGETYPEWLKLISSLGESTWR